MTKTFFLSKRYYPLLWTLMHIHVLNCHCFSMAFYWKVLPKWDIKMCVFMVSLNTFHLSPLDQAKIWLKPNLIFSIQYMYICIYRETFAPVLFSLFLPSMSAIKFNTWQIPMSNNFSFKHNCLGEFKTGQDCLQMYKGKNYTRRK